MRHGALWLETVDGALPHLRDALGQNGALVRWKPRAIDTPAPAPRDGGKEARHGS